MIKASLNFNRDSFSSNVSNFCRDTVKKSMESAVTTIKNQASNILENGQRNDRGIARKAMHLFKIIRNQKIQAVETKDGMMIGLGDISSLNNVLSTSGKKPFAYWTSLEYGITKPVPRPLLWQRGKKVVTSSQGLKKRSANDKVLITTATTKRDSKTKRKRKANTFWGHVPPIQGSKFKKYAMYSKASKNFFQLFKALMKTYRN